MKRAFTLVELLVVVGLMGLMATIAIGSYSGITRGMNDRAALDAAKSFADAALQRANLDRKSTYVYLFNEVTKLDTDMDAGIVCGVAVAVRAIGRITAVPSTGFWCDEFGDLNGTFDALEENGEEMSEGEKKAATTFFRLYNISQPGYAPVQEGVFPHEVNERDLEDSDSHKMVVYGFKKTASNQEGGGTTFRVGDLYGQEFVVTRLPPGYAFSESISMSSTSDLGMKQVGDVTEIQPNETQRPSIRVYKRRPDGNFDSIGGTRDGKGDGES